MKICWKCTPHQAIQDEDEIVSSSEQIWRNLLHLQWILCSEWVPSEWVQTADKNIRVIHTTPVHQLTSCEVKKKHVFVRKSIKLFLNSVLRLWHFNQLFELLFRWHPFNSIHLTAFTLRMALEYIFSKLFWGGGGWAIALNKPNCKERISQIKL